MTPFKLNSNASANSAVTVKVVKLSGSYKSRGEKKKRS